VGGLGADALIAARRRAMGLDPLRAAERCGFTYEGDAGNGVFRVPFLGADLRLTFPGLACEQLPDHITALLVYHLAISDGSCPAGRWLSFADLPDGSFYVTAFRGYTGAVLARRFAGERARLESALAGLGAQPLPGLADVAWRVPALPRVPLALLWWDADDEFDARADLLFDETAPRQLPTDGCAVLVSWLTTRLQLAAGLG
jgi:hypothetical protein